MALECKTGPTALLLRGLICKLFICHIYQYLYKNKRKCAKQLSGYTYNINSYPSPRVAERT